MSPNFTDIDLRLWANPEFAKARLAKESTFEEASDYVLAATGIKVRDRDDMENAWILVEKIRRQSGTRVSLLGFSHDWRAVFATFDLGMSDHEWPDSVDVRWMPVGKTAPEAIVRAAVFHLCEVDADSYAEAFRDLMPKTNGPQHRRFPMPISDKLSRA